MARSYADRLSPPGFLTGSCGETAAFHSLSESGYYKKPVICRGFKSTSAERANYRLTSLVGHTAPYSSVCRDTVDRAKWDRGYPGVV